MNTPGHAKQIAAIADGIQNIMAARLGRGFRPLAILFAAGAVGVFGGPGPGLPLALGALLASGEMLAYGMRIVQKALGRPTRVWMHLAFWGSVLPPLFAAWVFGWLGLRGLAVTPFGLGSLAAVLYVVLGVWYVRAWMQVVEVERLATVMLLNTERGAS